MVIGKSCGYCLLFSRFLWRRANLVPFSLQSVPHFQPVIPVLRRLSSWLDSSTYLAGVDAVVVVRGVSAAVLGLVRQALPQVVHAVLAARPANMTAAHSKRPICQCLHMEIHRASLLTSTESLLAHF